MTSSAASDRELHNIKRQNAADRRALRDQRKRTRERMDEARREQQDKEGVRRHNAIVTGLVPRLAGAIDSWAGKRVPFKVEHPAYTFRAVTDFQSIEIQIPAIDDVDLDFAGDLRGLAYHEAGHILKSIPFPTLLDLAMPLDETAGTGYARNQFIEQATGYTIDQLHHYWNLLEDQRMESAMVRESHNLGRYYNVIVLTHVISKGVSPDAHLLLYGRKHVDATVREAARAAYVETYGEDLAVKGEDLIDTYKRSNDPLLMWECVAQMTRLVESAMDEGGMGGGHGLDSVDQHNERYRRPEDDEDGEAAEKIDASAEPEPADDGDEGDDDEGKGSKGKGSKDADEDADEDDDEGAGARAGQDGDGGDEGEDVEGNSNIADRLIDGERADETSTGASGSVNDPDWTRRAIQEAINRGREERNAADGNIQNDVRAYQWALQDNRANGLPLPRIPTLADPDPAALAEGTKLNRTLRNLMEMARAQTAPSWQVNQTRGVLDVNRYLTRQRGDLEFFRQYAEGGDLQLPDMAVSVVLDGSGSMSGYDQALAIAAFGMKSACDVCSIPCVVTVYDTDAYLLWDVDDRPLEVPQNITPCGGTEPKRCLDMLDMQTHGKGNHLVIIMTDGAWSGEWQTGKYSLANYSVPNRDMVMFYFGMTPHVQPDGVNMCSLVQQIDDLSEMPRFLQRYITRAM